MPWEIHCLCPFWLNLRGVGLITPPPWDSKAESLRGGLPLLPPLPLPLCMPPSELKNTVIFPISLLIGERSAAVCYVQWAHAYNATKKLRLGLHCDKIQQIKGSKLIGGEILLQKLENKFDSNPKLLPPLTPPKLPPLTPPFRALGGVTCLLPPPSYAHGQLIAGKPEGSLRL